MFGKFFEIPEKTGFKVVQFLIIWISSRAFLNMFWKFEPGKLIYTINP